MFLIDVREPNEYEIVSIPGAKLIPKGEFLNGTALEKLPQDKQIVLHCKSGVRSAEVLAIAQGAGFADAVHVGGGVSAGSTRSTRGVAHHQDGLRAGRAHLRRLVLSGHRPVVAPARRVPAHRIAEDGRDLPELGEQRLRLLGRRPLLVVQARYDPL
jgi:rhodanese-related sulfurtransferase